MWLLIAKKEIKQALQNRIIIIMGFMVWILLLIAFLGGLKNYKAMTSEQQAAKEMFNKELTERDRDPHGATHYGTYLFKPMTALSLYDPGVNNYAGIRYRVEAHKQSEMNLATARDSDALMRFGELSVASVFELLIPLLIVFLCFQSVTKERENGTLKLLFSQGLSRRSLLWGKIWGNYFIIMIIVLPAFLLILGRGIFETDTFLRPLLFSVSFAIYFLIATCICVSVSSLCRMSNAALIVSLCGWICVCIIVPKVVAVIASTTYPLTSYYEFNKLVENDFFEGAGQDGTYALRREKLEERILAEYGVDSVSSLPVNLEGLMYQDAEEYNSKVYHTRYIPITKKLAGQKDIFKTSAYVSPYMAINQSAMAIAGTDLYHTRDFHQKAGEYRDYFVRVLNMALAKSKVKKGPFMVSTTFLENIEPFDYDQPSVSEIVGKEGAIIFSLVYWLVAIVLFVEICTRKKITV